MILLSAAACDGAHLAHRGGNAAPPGSDGEDAGVGADASSDAGGAGGGANDAAIDAGPAGAPGTVTVAVGGPGRITSTPPGIDCGAGYTACTAPFTAATVVLTTDGATTVRWGGDCAGNGDCALSLDAGRSVTAETFAPLRRTFDGPDHGADACFAIASGPADSIVVAGQIARIAQGHDAWARAYDAGGGIQWTYELSTPSEGHDVASGVVALPDGGALVAGAWFSGSNTAWNRFLVDVAATGALAWSQLDEDVGDDLYSAIARDPAGRLVLASSRPGTDGPEAWLRALAADGHTERWAITRTGTAPGGARATGVAADPAGDVVAVGSETNLATGLDGWIARYAPDGTPRWSVSLASPGPDADTAQGVAIAPDGSVAVVGSLDGAGSIRVYTAAGAPRWDVTAVDGPTWSGVAVDAAGNVVVAGSLGADLVARKYTPAGALVWQRTVAGARGNAVAIDGHGNALVCGSLTTGSSTDGLVVGFLQ